MTSRKIGIAVSFLAVCLFTVSSALAADKTDKVKGKGVITLRSGSTLTVETDEGTATVTLTDDTKVQHPIGLGARKKDVGQDVLIPGLRLKYEGTGDSTQVTAERIIFDQDDLSLAKVIQAGLNPTVQQQASNMAVYKANKEATDAEIAANQAATQAAIAQAQQEIAANQVGIDAVALATAKRFSELGDFVVKGERTVYFATGDYSLSGEDKNALAALANKALTYEKGYAIQVSAFADSVGTAASNQVLSKERAQAVVAYLLQECNIPVGRIVAPGAMGETNPVASNETPSGRSDNRRAEVKLLVNKGIAVKDVAGN
ncbi:MAG TPA: OmpA family protein [Acidobacteriaceae bacterium]|jgi:OOP family OmpA-OmpF porin|nr:OmpA family protein [Acidobacteriaceae bacterium]